MEREFEFLYYYRLKSLKNINVYGDLLRKSYFSKVRERYFFEIVFIDNVLSGLIFGNEFFNNSGYSRRFKFFFEFSFCDEKENWVLYNSRIRMGRKFVIFIFRFIDYGIFGKE